MGIRTHDLFDAGAERPTGSWSLCEADRSQDELEIYLISTFDLCLFVFLLLLTERNRPQADDKELEHSNQSLAKKVNFFPFSDFGSNVFAFQRSYVTGKSQTSGQNYSEIGGRDLNPLKTLSLNV